MILTSELLKSININTKKEILSICKNNNISYNIVKYNNNLIINDPYIVNRRNIEDLSNKTWIYINDTDYNKILDIVINNNPINILDFINNNNYNIELGKWFYDIWYPLFKNNSIIITNEILKFIYDFKGDYPYCNNKIYQFKRNYKAFLIKNDIEFKIIKYNENIIDYYPILKNEINIYSNNNLKQKTWLILSVNDFKESVMLMNNSNSKNIRKYYIKIENILSDYSNYVSEFRISKLKESNEKIKNLIINNKQKYKNGYICILTTKMYENINKYIIHKTENINDFLNSSDDMYLCYYKKVYNIEKIESLLLDVLENFIDKQNRNIVIINYKYLIKIIDLLTNSINSSYDCINDMIKDNFNILYK
ncbi:N1R/p28-like protein [Mythimna separata entomopoxvirus 'L']|uniref:N1R/p28-like protein n=1 Tax=Mythimna separata entomopoxvirus 'L' TaxID=1293572 RepID=A0A916KPW8_9POXV|nr:N1R/p28-like protein [Mythimna separata entomopoxvirus 'L']CCU56218.1 N1R/p28-like protein [Mythimna separata entomopoxvirus 'L']